MKELEVLININMNFSTGARLSKLLLLLTLVTIPWLFSIQISWAIPNYFAQSDSSQPNISQDLYLRNCSSCHIPIPAQVLPTESWQRIINSSQNHYGVALPTSVKVSANFIWIYLKNNSRPGAIGETLPTYVSNSRYLRALHPNVQLPKPANHNSCESCHPFAQKLDYFTVSEP